MLKIFENAITNEELEYLITEFNNLKATHLFKDEVYYIEHDETLKKIYNKDEKVVQQCRFELNGLPVGDKVIEILKRIADPGEKIDTLPIWASVADFPIGIHADTTNDFAIGNTFLIPLTFNENIKTVVWKPLMGHKKINEFIKEFSENGLRFPKKSNTSREVDVEHCWLAKPSIVNAMELDGIASWNKGVIIKFDRRQPHASNNWKPFEDFKHYIVVHAK